MVVLRRPDCWPNGYSVVVSAWDVFDRATSRKIGQVVMDDVEPFEPGGARHLWHACLEGDNEACGSRQTTRADAVDDLLREDRWEREQRERAATT